jgi:hypothetical protein
MLAKLPIGLVWATWLLILLLELATPPAVVLGILYVVPLLLRLRFAQSAGAPAGASKSGGSAD